MEAQQPAPDKPWADAHAPVVLFLRGLMLVVMGITTILR